LEFNVSISCKCPHCGKQLKAPDSAAGKRAKCPGCGEAVQLPKQQVFEAEEVASGDGGDDEFGLQNMDASEAYGGPAAEERRPCPACGEMIMSTAAKCRYCGEIFDETLKRKEKKKKSVSADDADLTPGDWVFCILCGGIACIFGIVYAIQGKPKGMKMVGVSLLSAVAWNILNVALQTAMKGK
jgi:DNA-directed RNA polymerase subunit M/transcription elongation factor TFIIS